MIKEIAELRDRHLAYLFLLPGILLSAIFIIVPFLMAVQLSFYKMNSFISIGTYSGIQNYIDLLKDPQFWSDFWNGIVYTTFSVAFQVVIGIGFALLLNENFKGMGFLRGSVVVPYILPTVVVALIWYWMLNEQIGVVNALLKEVGIKGLLWFENPTIAMISVVLVSVWTWTPFVTVCFLAGLQGVPKTLYEAAQVDGASGWNRFIHITLPVLKPILVVVILLRSIWMFNKFDIIWLLTQGGPVRSTEHLPILSYRKAFLLYDVGGGTAVATLSLIFLSFIIFLYFKLFAIEK